VRIGCRRVQGNVYFTTAVEPPRARHKIDQMHEYLTRLGVGGRFERHLVLEQDEWSGAETVLAPIESPRIGMFVGARERKGKGWPLATAAAVACGLREAGLSPVIFLGPEETRRASEIRGALAPASFVHEPDLRKLAALLSHCAAVVAPDSGPMHLAVAAGAPTVAVFRRAEADKWGPRPPRGESILDPTGREVHRVVSAVLRLATSGGSRGATAKESVFPITPLDPPPAPHSRVSTRSGGSAGR
jgi:ADP-heptose:LPS heptosyltransferase